jgi:hypothetical protein
MGTGCRRAVGQLIARPAKAQVRETGREQQQRKTGGLVGNFHERAVVGRMPTGAFVRPAVTGLGNTREEGLKWNGGGSRGRASQK